jgi:hypothetical protein
MAKDLIIGAYSNYKFDLLKPWVFSIKETGFDGDIVLIAIDPDTETVSELEAVGVKVVRAKNEQKMMIHMLRFLHIYNYLKLNPDYRYVITTDVRDVIFQKNPTDYLRTVFGSRDKGIISQSEAIKIKDEAWNRDNIIKNFGHYFYSDVCESPVYNVGILAGTTAYIKDLCFALFQMSSNRPDWVADQAAYNMILNYMPWSNVAVKLELSHGWALNAHVTNKPDQLEQFGPYLLEERPYMENGTVYNSQGKPFTIVHQYDRVPEWMQYYMEKFQFSIKSDTNTGTSPKYFTYKT